MMRLNLNSRWLGTIALGVALLSPVVLTGCAEHSTVRAYDPYYNNYYAWNDHEVVYYLQWVAETHRPYRDYHNLPPPEQREYWAWRHGHPDHH
jgi:hypothetical protein